MSNSIGSLLKTAYDGNVIHLPDPGFKKQIAIAIQTHTGLEERLEGVALPIQAVHNSGA